MSHLQFGAYPGFGDRALESAYYSQSVVVPNAGSQIVISGQGGWDRETSEISSDRNEELAQAFDNVRETIERAGGKMSHVYKLTVYFAPYDDKISAPFLEQRKYWFPTHKPTVTAVAVPRLAFEKMTVEIEAWAHLG